MRAPITITSSKLPTNTEAARRDARQRTKGYFERLVRRSAAASRASRATSLSSEQGLFYIGYYHQRQDFFTKRTRDNRGDER